MLCVNRVPLNQIIFSVHWGSSVSKEILPEVFSKKTVLVLDANHHSLLNSCVFKWSVLKAGHI